MFSHLETEFRPFVEEPDGCTHDFFHLVKLGPGHVFGAVSVADVATEFDHRSNFKPLQRTTTFWTSDGQGSLKGSDLDCILATHGIGLKVGWWRSEFLSILSIDQINEQRPSIRAALAAAASD